MLWLKGIINMGIEDSSKSTSDSINSWVITIIIIVISFSGITLSLICIYALPDRTVKPFDGSLYFAAASVVIVALLVYFMNREKRLLFQKINQLELKNQTIIVQENISDKILKWIVTLFSLFFILASYSTALICIYALPDKTTQPLAGIAYFCSGALVLSVLLIVLWKNWASKRPQQTGAGEPSAELQAP